MRPGSGRAMQLVRTTGWQKGMDWLAKAGSRLEESKDSPIIRLPFIGCATMKLNLHQGKVQKKTDRKQLLAKPAASRQPGRMTPSSQVPARRKRWNILSSKEF